MTTIDIIGGGTLGLSLAYSLLKRGVGVRVWERSADLGGSMGRATFRDIHNFGADRSCHAMRHSDHNLLSLIGELGLSSELHTAPTKTGLYHNGNIVSFSSLADFLRFGALPFHKRARLAWTLRQVGRVKDWRTLEHESAVEWLARLGGADVTEQVWKPLLRAKFDGDCDNVSATYVWSQWGCVTGAGATPAKQHCFLAGGHNALVQALARAIRQLGGEIHTGAKIDQVRVRDNIVAGLQIAGGEVDSEGVVLTQQTPLAHPLLPPVAVPATQHGGAPLAYLGLVCMVLVLRRSLMPYHTLHIADDRVPFTNITETTNLINRAHTNGYHLVYLPKYVGSNNVFAQMDDEALEKAFMVYLRQLFPDLRENDVAAIHINRERYAEPLRPLGRAETSAPVVSTVDGLYLVNNAQIHPHVANTEAAVAHAQQHAEQIALAQARLARPRELMAAA